MNPCFTVWLILEKAYTTHRATWPSLGYTCINKNNIDMQPFITTSLTDLRFLLSYGA